jgi:hypothetical protein
MEYRPLNAEQRNVLLKAIEYTSDEDYRGDKGIVWAGILDKSFGGDVPKIIGLTEKKIEFYDIINSKDPRILNSRVRKKDFKGLFGKLKKAGYKGSGEKGMKNYFNMTEIEMLNYYRELRSELDIFR